MASAPRGSGPPVAIGVAVLLGVFAEFHAFQADANRSCWECTQGATVPKALGTGGELWNYSADFYQGRTIERLDLAALGSGAPVPPGVSRLPGPGQYYASPALAALLRTVPRDELGDRFPGTMIGTIERVIIDKASGNVSCAVLSFNGFVHIGRKHLAIPWRGLTYDRTTASYNLDLAENDLVALCRASGVDPGNRGGKSERANNRRKAYWGIAETW